MINTASISITKGGSKSWEASTTATSTNPKKIKNIKHKSISMDNIKKGKGQVRPTPF